MATPPIRLYDEPGPTAPICCAVHRQVFFDLQLRMFAVAMGIARVHADSEECAYA